MKPNIIIGLFCVMAALPVFGQSHKIGENLPKMETAISGEYAALYEEAKRLYQMGNYDDAEPKLQVIAAKYPHHSPSVQLLTLIDQNRRNDPSAKIRDKLDAVMLPQVNFREATADSVLEFLRDEVRRLSRDNKGVNFVINIPPEIKARKITLDVRDMPASDVLKFVSELAGFKFRFERSAVYIHMDADYKPAAPAAETAAVIEPPQPAIPGASIPGAAR